MRYLLSLFTLNLMLVTGIKVAGQSPLSFRDTSIKSPQTFAIVVGISKYKYVRPLAYADKDAELFRDYLKSPAGGSLVDNNIFCLLNEQADNSNFWGKGFQWLKAKQLRKGDRLFIYLAGHGDAIDENEFFFLGYDCNPKGDKNNYLVSGAIQLFNLKNKIAREASKGVEVFFIMDACRSNELPGGQDGQNFLNTAISEKKVGDIMMLATGAGQESLEDASIGNGHGLFTYYLVDGLSGVADIDGIPDNRVTFTEIKSYVAKNVPILALQRFKRKQDPYFCCNEFNENVVGRVDTAYLKKWLQTKKLQPRGGGNSAKFTEASGTIKSPFSYFTADTILLETYNRFYQAIKSNNLTGQSSAEEYFQQLDKKYPGNPYTLDAKSTLAVEYINVAQDKVDRYLGCGDDGSAREKQSNYTAALNLEKAIKLVREYDEEFANSLYNRMYLLKASGDFGKDGKDGDLLVAFQNAYAARAINPNGAYILNKLALLHLENNNPDSALYYANKATKTAPDWLCALTTLAMVKKAVEQPKQNNPDKQTANKPTRKNSFGGVAGSGISQLNPSFAVSRNSNIIGINARDIIKADFGVFYQAGFSNNISIRPSTLISIEGGELVYDRQNATGGAIFHDTVKLKNTSVSVSVPLIIHLSSKKIAPFISFGPSFTYILSQDANSADKVPVKKSVILGDVALGVDIAVGKSRLMLSPELKYTQGFNDQREDAGNDFTNTLSSLKKRGITFSVYLRGR